MFSFISSYGSDINCLLDASADKMTMIVLYKCSPIEMFYES